MALDFVAGCIGGSAGLIAGYPLDTLKVHVQAGRGGAREVARRLVRADGAAALFRGIGAPLAGVAAINALVFGAYGCAHRQFANPDTLSAHALAGAASGFIQSATSGPVELVKTRQQLAGGTMSALDCAREIVRRGGARALTRGLAVTAVRDTPAFAIYFASYEAMTRGSASTGRVFAAGGAAGVLSWVLLYPIDVLKSRLQADAAGRYAGVFHCARESVRADGWAWMWRGLSTVALRAFICNGACFTAVCWTLQASEALRDRSLLVAAEVVDAHPDIVPLT